MKHHYILLTAFALLLSATLCCAQNTQTFTYQGFVFQTYTIPVSGYYLLTSKGGEGGSFRYVNDPSDRFIGGKGASMSCYYFFNEGEQLRIAVAGAGQSVVDNGASGQNNIEDAGGGGGASSIVLPNGSSYLAVLIAGGGGGAGNGRDGDAGQVTQNGTPGRRYDGVMSGSAGVKGLGGGSANDDGNGAGGAGFFTDGGTPKHGLSTLAWGGQAYLGGNYGGGDHAGGDGGWGGGGEGGHGYAASMGCVRCPGQVFLMGSGGGGGGYSGGGAGFTLAQGAGGGGGGGSFISSIANTNGLVQLPGNNSGNGVVTITGPITQTDVVNTPFNPYTWPANGMSYSAAGTYTFRDSVNSVIRILDLSFGLQSCPSYTRIDTTIVSCGSYTSPLNGRTYTENTTDSIRVGCVKYVARIVVAPPVALLGWLPVRATNTSSTGTLAVCKNTTQTITIPPVPYATSYRWTLPSGAKGTSTQNRINVEFGKNFRGGNICVTPVNACGAGASICRPIVVLNTPPKGALQITKPAAPHVSGSYSVAPIPGATYTWSVSGSKAIIVSGQGTSEIHLKVLPGFTRANLSVRASNCEGKGSKRTLVIQAQQNSSDDDDNDNDDDDKTTDLSKVMPEIPVSIYPNPSNGRFTLNTPSLKRYAVLEVNSEDGRLVYRTQIPAHTTQSTITLPKQTSSGIYYLRLLTENGVKSMRLVKK